MLQDLGLGRNGFRLLDLLFGLPVVNARWVERELEVTYATANNLLARFAEAGLVDKITGGKRNRRFRYAPYVELFATSVEVSSSREEEASATSSVAIKLGDYRFTTHYSSTPRLLDSPSMRSMMMTSTQRSSRKPCSR